MSITIKELKEAIAHLPDDAHLSFSMASGCCGDYESLELSEGFEFESYLAQKSNEVSTFIFYFNSLPGYKSCRQAGGTLQADKEYWKDKK